MRLSIANRIKNVKTALAADIITISLTLAKLKYSIVNTMTQYSADMESRYFA